MPVVNVQITHEGTAPERDAPTAEEKAALIKGISQVLLDTPGGAGNTGVRGFESIEITCRNTTLNTLDSDTRDPAARTHSGTATATLRLQVVADLICPWCFIGKRSLDRALDILAGQGLHVEVEWLPYQLNPTMPSEGMDRKEFRTMRFGWEASLAMDARAVEAGRRFGAEFNYSLQSRTPNTVAAHALVRLAREEGGAQLQDLVVDALFKAYFTQGQDIGEHAVLERIALSAGMAPGAVRRSLAGHDEIRRSDARIKTLGLNGVPSYLLDGELLFSGSQDVQGYVTLLMDAAGRAN